jgi:hexosaminidase
MRPFLLLVGLLFSCLAPAQQAFVLNVIPAPALVMPGTGNFSFQCAHVNGAETIAGPVALLSTELANGIQRNVECDKTLPITLSLVKPDTVVPDETYWLKINERSIDLQATTEAGLFRGTRTLIQLADQEQNGTPVPCATIVDYPRFAWRGMHLDVSRHFFPVDFVKKYIDLLARYKMNRFHWHLTDDQGWRIEIKKYPKLTEVGAWRSGSQYGPYSDRTYDSTRYGGFYTQEQIREVVAYATARHITVVPEIEMPGHSLAALAAYPALSCTGGPFAVAKGWGVFDDVYCTKDSVFGFMQDVLTEVMDLFPSEYIHIGGDECPKVRWQTCPKCQKRMKDEGLKDEHELQSYFIQRIEKFVNGKGRKIIGWDEILEGGLAPNAAVMSWRGTEGGIAAAKDKHFVVMTPGTHCYFDHYQGAPAVEPLAIGGYTTLQKAYAYEPIPDELTAMEARYILGAQGNVWTEYMTTSDHVEYMAMPRMAALAEVLWSPKSARNEREFIRRLEQEMPALDRLHVHYSRSLYNVEYSFSGSKSRGKVIMALKTTPGLGDVHYTLDGSEPTVASARSVTPIELLQSTTVKAALFRDGQQISRTTTRAVQFDLGTGRKVVCDPLPNPRYDTGGSFTLVDGVSAGARRVSNEWLGWNNDKVLITVDLGAETDLSHLGIGSLEERTSWIHLPKVVTIATSADGTAWTDVAQVIPAPDADGRTELGVDRNVRTRFVRFTVRSHGPIEAGWPGAGSMPWYFLDEIHLR